MLGIWSLKQVHLQPVTASTNSTTLACTVQVCGVYQLRTLYSLFSVQPAVSFTGCQAYTPYIWEVHCAAQVLPTFPATS